MGLAGRDFVLQRVGQCFDLLKTNRRRLRAAGPLQHVFEQTKRNFLRLREQSARVQHGV